MQSCNIKRQPENPDSELRTKRLFLYCIQQHTHTFILCNSNKHVLKGFPATLKATKWALCWHHRPDISDFLKWCSDLLLQLCLVSILGFILYFITYLPDERTSMQFICKVSLQHTHTDRRWHTNLPRHIRGQIRFLSAERVHLTRVLVAATVWSDVWVFRQTALFYSPRCYGYKCKWRGERKAFLFFKEKLSGDSCEWMSAFINATRLFGLISRTIYAVGISRQLKSVHHCVFFR